MFFSDCSKILQMFLRPHLGSKNGSRFYTKYFNFESMKMTLDLKPIAQIW